MNTSDDTRDNIVPNLAFQGSVDRVIWAIIAIQIIVAVYGFAVLPDTVPIHWGFNGQVNGYGPKWMGTFLFPLISIGIYALIHVGAVVGRRGEGRENVVAHLQIGKIILMGVMLFMLIVQLSTLAQSLDIGFDMTIMMKLATSLLFIFLGNYLGKVRRNFWIGIRTPWTLANPVVWERTHRLGGWLFVAVGLIGIPCSFIPSLHFWGILAPIIVVSIFLCIYSYVCYQQQMQKGHDPLSSPLNGDN